MSLVKRELSKKEHSKHMYFPDVVKHPSIVIYRFPDEPLHYKDEYMFKLYIYNKNKPVLKHKQSGKWISGGSYSFDFRKDFFLQEGFRYALKTVIYIKEEMMLVDVLYIDNR